MPASRLPEIWPETAQPRTVRRHRPREAPCPGRIPGATYAFMGMLSRAIESSSAQGLSAIASGPGAGARNSIGIMLVSGMIIGTFFTLFVVPSIYMLIARTHVASGEEEAVAAETEAEEPGRLRPQTAL